MSHSVLEQVSPQAATLQDLFTVPPGYSADIASVSICNTTGVDRIVRLAIVKGGGATVSASYVLYDAALPPKMTLEWSISEDLRLGGGDTIRIYADAAGVAFGVFGTTDAVQSSTSLMGA